MTADQPFMLLLPCLYYLVSYTIFKLDNSIKMISTLDDGDVVLATVVCAGLSSLIR